MKKKFNMKAYYQKHREKIRAQQKAYRQRPDVKAKKKAYREKRKGLSERRQAVMRK